MICHGVFRAVRKIEPVGALVHGSTLTERQMARRAGRQARRAGRTNLAAYRGGGISRRLALLDLRAESGQWVLIPIVFFLAAVLVTLPTNLLSTFENPRFITYLGAPDSDLRADVQFTDDVDTIRDELVAGMRNDDDLADVRTFAHVSYEIDGADGPEMLRVEVGDYTDHTIEFIDGDRPEHGQIALSALNADKFGVGVGDSVSVRRDGRATVLFVSGIYQDITSGGLTAKMPGKVTSGADRYAIFADVIDGVDPATVAANYDERFPEANVTPMREEVEQSFSYLTSALRSAAVVSLVVGVAVVLLITCLFLQLRLAKDRGKMGVLSAIGFSTAEIIGQVRWKMIIAMVIGVAAGLGFAATAGEALVGLLIGLAGLGIVQLSFLPDPWLVYVAYPLILIGVGFLGTVLITRRLHDADKSAWLS